MEIPKENFTFSRLKLIKKLQLNVDAYRQQLTLEMISQATDPTVLHRRMRMLSQLSAYESQILAKIKDFVTTDINDLQTALHEIELELVYIINRNA